jgi:hypothetical protein
MELALAAAGDLRGWSVKSCGLHWLACVVELRCAMLSTIPERGNAWYEPNSFVSDSTGKRIREFHLDTLRQGLDLPINGLPTNIAGGGGGG